LSAALHNRKPNPLSGPPIPIALSKRSIVGTKRSPQTASRLLKKWLLICRSVILWGRGWGWRCVVTTRFAAAFSAT
jgi:hypothetical protein